jgi:hypothetical protein
MKPEYPPSLPDRLRAFASEGGWDEELLYQAAGEIDRLREQVVELERELSLIAKIATEGCDVLGAGR